METITVATFATRHVKIFLKPVSDFLWPMPCTPPPVVLYLASVKNTGGIAIDVWAMNPDFSLPRSTHASACGHTAKTSALGSLELRVLHYSLIVQSIEVFRFPRRLRPRCLSLSKRTIYSVPSSKRLLIVCPRSLRPWDVCACARTRSNGWWWSWQACFGSSIHSASCLWCPQSVSSNTVRVECSSSQFWLALLTTTRCYNANHTIQLLVMISSAGIASIK